MTHLNELTVKTLTALSGVSVRTLHYYDEIDLLKPARTAAGYRVYETKHIVRLQQILIQKSLGLSLAEIRSALDDPDFDHVTALRSQKKILLDRIETAKTMISSIDATIENLSKETTMKVEAVFNGFDAQDHEAEAHDLWGETKAYMMSRKRTNAYGKGDWKRIKAEETSIWDRAAEAMSSGLSPASAEASELVACHRRYIDKWFYSTSAVSYASLADMWESDQRFKHNLDRHGEGLTAWFAEAARTKYAVI